MGIFEIFKAKKPEVEKQKIKFSDLKSFIQKKDSEIQIRKDNFDKLVEKELSVFIENLNENLKNLRKVDLENKKIEERVKLIVKENLNHYIHHLELLIEKLSDKNEAMDVDKINKLIFDFEKKAHMHYEKATFLIGKEMEAVKNSISEFFKNLKQIINENNVFLEEQKIIAYSQKKLKQTEDNEKSKKEIEENVKETERKTDSVNGNMIDASKELQKLRNSEEYSQETEKNYEFERKIKDFEKEIIKIKQFIDFKKLSGIFHSDEKKMKIIKHHQDNFAEFIEKDDSLLKLMEEADISDPVITQKIYDLVFMKKEISTKPEKAIENRIKEKETELKRLESDKQILEEEMQREQKKIEKLNENDREILDSVKNELIKINVEVVE